MLAQLGMQARSHRRTLCGLAAFAILVVVVNELVERALATLHVQLTVDDAYMFVRYARHVHDGLGVSWNMQGPATYGLTSQGWLAVIMLFSLLPLSASVSLQLASLATGVLGLALICAGVRNRGISAASGAIAAIGAAYPVFTPRFGTHLSNGMDTMLAFTVNAAIVFLVLDYMRRPSRRLAVVLGVAGFLAVVVRPDSIICALGAPAIAWLLQGRDRRKGDLWGLIAVPAALLAVFVAACWQYYGVPLPLSFYAKSANSYVGYLGHVDSVARFIDFLVCAGPFVLISCLAGIPPRHFWAITAPALATACYLVTVTQIMGEAGRFFIPLLPSFMIPALLALDRAVAKGVWPGKARMALGGAAYALGLILIAAQGSIAAWHHQASLPTAVPEPPLAVAASSPLPQRPWFDNIRHFSDGVAARLPAGTVIAASEVGYLGIAAPHVAISDLAGLRRAASGQDRRRDGRRAHL